MSNPKINTEFIFTMPLFKNGQIVVNPTIAAGDITVHTAGVDKGNIDTLAAVTPASQESVKVTLSADEMNGAYVGVVFIDQTSPKAWDDVYVSIETSANTVDEIATVTNALTSAAAANLALSAAGIIGGSVDTGGTHTKGKCFTTLDSYAADELINRTIVFTSGTAAPCAAVITDYIPTNGEIVFASQIATTPVNADTFVIV